MSVEKSIITSNRKFGVEIEVGAEHIESIHQASYEIGGVARLMTDVSITCPNGHEFVSNVLGKNNGEKAVKQICSSLKSNNVLTDDSSCGLHVHLDAPEFLNEKKYIPLNDCDIVGYLKANKDKVVSLLSVDKKLVFPNIGNLLQVTNTNTRSKGNAWLAYYKRWNVQGLVVEREVDGAKFLSRALGVLPNHKMELLQAYYNYSLKESQLPADEVKEAHVKAVSNILKNSCQFRVFAEINNTEPYKRVKALMAHFILFNDVFMAMVPESRRIKNSYCMPFSDFFTLEDVAKVSNYKEFEQLWYKTTDDEEIESSKNYHFDNSRYLNFNLHTLFNRTKTVEIRCLGSTKDENQILLWTALHQHCIDKLAKLSVTYEQLAELSNENDTLSERVEKFFEVYELPVYLQVYVKKMIEHFSKITI